MIATGKAKGKRAAKRAAEKSTPKKPRPMTEAQIREIIEAGEEASDLAARCSREGLNFNQAVERAYAEGLRRALGVEP